MNLKVWIRVNRLKAFLLGTLLVQGVIFGGAVYYNQALASAESYVLKTAEQYSTFTGESETSTPKEKRITTVPQTAPVKDESPRASIKTPTVETESVKPESISYKVKAGDTFSKIWTLHGAPYAGALKAAGAIKKSGITGAALRSGETIELYLSAGSDIIKLVKRLKGGKELVLEGDSQNGYIAKMVKRKATVTEQVAVGTIESSFAVAAAKSNVPYDVIDQLVDLFGNKVVFRRDIKKGDEFAVVYYIKSYYGGEITEIGPIKAASLKIAGKMMAAVRHVGRDGRGRYFDEDGDPLERYFLRYPVKFSRISSVFSGNRLHPILRRKRPHNGVDFAAPVGTSVRSVADGVVEAAGWFGGNGRMVKIRHDSRYTTAYLHLSAISRGIKKGARVKRGQIIGKVGASGLATGPHLHFAMYSCGRYVDPLKIELPRQPVAPENLISGDYLKTAITTLSVYHKLYEMSLTWSFPLL